jgi:hypothetical protein
MINSSHYSRSVGLDLNPWPPEYEARVLTTRPWRSIKNILNIKNVINGETSLDKYFFSVSERTYRISQKTLATACFSQTAIRRKKTVCAKNVPLGEAIPTK